MGLFDKIKNEFVDVIEWPNEGPNDIVWKFPRYQDEIKNGAQLIVRESQNAVFLHEGALGDVFGPGRVELTTKNIPVLTSLASWKYLFDSPFKCDVFFVNTKQFTDLKWGTKNPIMLRDPEFGPIRLRAFGSYCFQVKDAGKFLTQMSGIQHNFQSDEVVGQLRNMLVSRFTDALGEAKVPALDLASQYDEIGALLKQKMQADFDDYGIELTQFFIENISLPPEVEEALDKRSSMGIIGNMNQYTQYQTANAIEDMANNPGGNGMNMMGMMAGMNMGNMMGGQMANAQQQPGQVQPPATPPPIPQQKPFYMAVNGAQQGPFDHTMLKQKVQSGELKKDTLVWSEGMAAWTAAGEVSELSDLFGAVPPPIPPTPPGKIFD